MHVHQLVVVVETLHAKWVEAYKQMDHPCTAIHLLWAHNVLEAHGTHHMDMLGTITNINYTCFNYIKLCNY